MTFNELSAFRSSVRKYTSEPVSEADITYILDCARLAPSAVNFQPWKFLVVESEEGREKNHKSYHREWFNDAPLYIICVADHSTSWKRGDGKDHADIDIAIAAEHICLAAAEKGLGSCWVCNFDPVLTKEYFNLPENEEPCVLIPIGHYPTDLVLNEKKRKTLEEIVVRGL
ncbi:MAG: nitroreductase family protein [Bacteroidales bacterium]|nr:nitroreductase family protein [Bacteroidales bacterium]